MKMIRWIRRWLAKLRRQPKPTPQEQEETRLLKLRAELSNAHARSLAEKP